MAEDAKGGITLSKFIFHYFFWDISFKKILFVLAVSILLFFVYHLFSFLFRKSYRALNRIVIAEELGVTCLVAFWASAFFCLHIALPIWFGFYFVYSKKENENRAIKYYHNYWNRKYNSDKFEKALAKMKMKSFLKELYAFKRKILNDTKLYLIPEEEWKTTRLSKFFYLDGFIVFSLSLFLWGNPYKETGVFGLIFFGNLMLATGPYYILWRFRYHMAKTPPSTTPEFVLFDGCLFYALLVGFVYVASLG